MHIFDVFHAVFFTFLIQTALFQSHSFVFLTNPLIPLLTRPRSSRDWLISEQNCVTWRRSNNSQNIVQLQITTTIAIWISYIQTQVSGQILFFIFLFCTPVPMKEYYQLELMKKKWNHQTSIRLVFFQRDQLLPATYPVEHPFDALTYLFCHDILSLWCRNQGIPSS